MEYKTVSACGRDYKLSVLVAWNRNLAVLVACILVEILRRLVAENLTTGNRSSRGGVMQKPISYRPMLLT